MVIIHLDGFYLGKVSEVQNKMFNITLFHYKLDLKAEITTEVDLSLNFGPYKSIFEMNDEQQKLLLNRVHERRMCSFTVLFFIEEVIQFLFFC